MRRIFINDEKTWVMVSGDAQKNLQWQTQRAKPVRQMVSWKKKGDPAERKENFSLLE